MDLMFKNGRKTDQELLFEKRLELLLCTDRAYQNYVATKDVKSYRRAKEWFDTALDSERKLLKTFDTMNAYLQWRHSASELIHGDAVFEHGFPFQQKKVIHQVMSLDEKRETER